MRMGNVQLLVMSALTMSLAACMSQFDMQGVDPKDYYAEHPIKNTVESHYGSYVAHFAADASTLTEDASDRMIHALHGISPLAADSVLIQYAKTDKHATAHREFIATELRHMGFSRDTMQFEPSDTLAHNEVRVDIIYSVVVAPDCPDWKTSPITTYSNTMQGNFACAPEVNLGLMVADPHDLVRGTGDVSPDSMRDAKVIQDYRGGKDFSASSSSASGSSGSGGPAAPSGQTPPVSAAPPPQ